MVVRDEWKIVTNGQTRGRWKIVVENLWTGVGGNRDETMSIGECGGRRTEERRGERVVWLFLRCPSAGAGGGGESHMIRRASQVNHTCIQEVYAKTRRVMPFLRPATRSTKEALQSGESFTTRGLKTRLVVS